MWSCANKCGAHVSTTTTFCCIHRISDPSRGKDSFCRVWAAHRLDAHIISFFLQWVSYLYNPHNKPISWVHMIIPYYTHCATQRAKLTWLTSALTYTARKMWLKKFVTCQTHKLAAKPRLAAPISCLLVTLATRNHYLTRAAFVLKDLEHCT